MQGIFVIELILGGNRSGKSQFAEKRAIETGLSVAYVATALIKDEEMAERIRLHRLRRPDSWELVESSVHLAQTLQELATPDRCLLVDCLTLWLCNLFFPVTATPYHSEHFDPDKIHALVTEEKKKLLSTLPVLPGHLIFVSNEIGLGGVPMDALSRKFSDEAGLLNQEIASLCDRVTFVAAGLPLTLK
jgi:adenosylcobinamide kinase/adenosylcobinamide-phosphate guanylyltransferase